jgi:hypothetical protein
MIHLINPEEEGICRLLTNVPAVLSDEEKNKQTANTASNNEKETMICNNETCY